MTGLTTSEVSPEARAVIRRMKEYVDDVLTGRIPACEKVIKACRRHESNLQSSRRKKYPWRFDKELAARPVLFMERYLVPTKGQYDSMALMGWQVFVLCSVYGWVDKCTGLRRFREALILVPRSNGKSTMISGVSTYGMTKDGERGADIYLLANTKEQAGIVYEECRNQILASPALSCRIRALRDRLHYDATASSIQHRSSDSKRLDGLAPHYAVFDELHGYRNFALINVIKRGTNKRRNPIIWYISTMGSVLDGPLVHYYQLFSDALEEGLMEKTVSDRLFSFICEIDPGDDVADERAWYKANPSLGQILSMDMLRDDWARAKGVPAERADFICKQLNVMVDSGDAGYVDIEVIGRNQGQAGAETLRTRRGSTSQS